MAFNEEYIELFDKVLQNQLSSQEKKQFESHLSDPEFENAFQEYKLIHGALIKNSRSKLKLHLKQLENELEIKDVKDPGVKKKKTNKLGGSLIIVLIILLATIAYVFIQKNKVLDKEELFLAYYSPFPNVIDPLDKGEPNQTKSVYQMYEQGQYQNAISELTDSLSLNSEWYLAQSYLATNQLDKAETLFVKIIENNGDYVNDAKWYLSLLYLKQNKIGKSTSYLRSLLKIDNSFYKQKSNELLLIIEP